MKYIIIGGVAGGASTAARLRRLDEEAEIILLEKGEYISYANCGLPYYIGDVIDERSKLFVQTPRSFAARFRVGVRVKSEVTDVLPDAKKVVVKDIETGREYEETYDKLVLSPGAEPVLPPLDGIQHPGIFTLRNVADTDRIKTFIGEHRVKRALIVGAGFIGLEMAENLKRQGIEVTVVEMANQVMTPVDYEVATFVHQELKDQGVNLRLEEAVVSFEKEGETILVALRSGDRLETELVLLSIGVRPDHRLASMAGLRVGETGGIWVNEYLQTSDPDIYAVGDAIEFPNPVTGRPSLSFLAGPTNKQGRICADNMVYGNRYSYKGAINTAIAKVFDMTVGSTGVAAKLLEKNSIPYQNVIIHASSHAGYYPGAMPLMIKINFSPEGGRLLGGQVVGYEGVDKRLEMLASVIRGGGSVFDLAELEQAYAPPFSSAKDPVNMAGFAADNLWSGKVQTIEWRNLKEVRKGEFILLDVRTPDEYVLGSIPGAINIPLDRLRQEIDSITPDRPIVVFCAVGLRGYIAARILSQRGFRVMNLNGGLKIYRMAIQEQGSSVRAKPETNTEEKKEAKEPQTVSIDACGLQCPGPVMKLKGEIEHLKVGERMKITATDNGFYRDVVSWAKMTGNQVVSLQREKGIITAVVEKGDSFRQKERLLADNKTLIVFSDDLDKAIASFVIANGAVSTGRKVTMFFTFWGLNVIKKEHPGRTEKDWVGKLFGWMLPSNSKKLSLSKMNMGGMGSWMMRRIMKSKKIDSLESLIQQARQNGVEFIACQMSMEVMGIGPEELLEGVNVGGVAAYLERAEEANVNLFI